MKNLKVRLLEFTDDEEEDDGPAVPVPPVCTFDMSAWVTPCGGFISRLMCETVL